MLSGCSRVDKEAVQCCGFVPNFLDLNSIQELAIASAASCQQAEN